MYYFTRLGFERFIDELAKISRRADEAGRLAGEACQTGHETTHDNFGFEDAKREQRMWSDRLRELADIAKQAAVVDSLPAGEDVKMGKMVTFFDENDGELRTVTIGSYMVFDGGEEISYASPLALLLRGGRVGDTRVGKIGDQQRTLRILAVQ